MPTTLWAGAKITWEGELYLKNINLTSDSATDNDFSLFDADGFFICPNCKERVEADVQGEYDLVPRRINIPCKCDRDSREKRIAIEKIRGLEAITARLRRESLLDPASMSCNFDNDDGSYPEITETCKRYVEHWSEMSANNIGLLMFGGTGIGKTFYATCIANALLDKQVSVIVATVPQLINLIQSLGFGFEKIEFYEKLQNCGALVLDDLGADRGTEYVIEQLFAIVDSRYRAKKPLIITTNLGPQDLTSPETLAYKRIYDRLLENCLRLKITGPSRRTAISLQKKEQFKNLLGL